MRRLCSGYVLGEPGAGSIEIRITRIHNAIGVFDSSLSDTVNIILFLSEAKESSLRRFLDILAILW